MALIREAGSARSADVFWTVQDVGGFCCARLCEGFGEVSVLDEYFDAERRFWLGWTDICPSVFEKWPRELCKYPLLVANIGTCMLVCKTL